MNWFIDGGLQDILLTGCESQATDILSDLWPLSYGYSDKSTTQLFNVNEYEHRQSLSVSTGFEKFKFGSGCPQKSPETESECDYVKSRLSVRNITSIEKHSIN